MHAREDTHRHMPRIVADEHLVDLENRAELSVQCLSRDVSQVEINLVLAADAVAIETDLKDFARRNVARHKIAVRRIFLFKKVASALFLESTKANDCRLCSAAPRRGRLRRAPIRSSGAACLRRGSKSDGPE